MELGGDFRDQLERDIDNSIGLGISNATTATRCPGPSNLEFPFDDRLDGDYDGDYHGILLPMSYKNTMAEIDAFDWNSAGVASKLGEYCTGEAYISDPSPSPDFNISIEMCEDDFVFTDRQINRSCGLVDARMTGFVDSAQSGTRTSKKAPRELHSVSDEAASQHAQAITSASNEPNFLRYMPFVESHVFGISEATPQSFISDDLDFPTADYGHAMDQELGLQLHAAQVQPYATDVRLQFTEPDLTEATTPKRHAAKHLPGESRYVVPKASPR